MQAASYGVLGGVASLAGYFQTAVDAATGLAYVRGWHSFFELKKLAANKLSELTPF
jgi:hypothetical protein